MLLLAQLCLTFVRPLAPLHAISVRPPVGHVLRCSQALDGQSSSRGSGRDAPTATRGRGQSWRGSRGGGGRGRGRGRGRGGGKMPRLGQLSTAAEVLAAHHEYGARFREMDLAAAWNSLGRLVRRSDTCRRQLGSPTESAALLAPLSERTLEQLPAFPARAVANTAHGMASGVTRT